MALGFETLRIIAPYAMALALVGLMESLMTAKLVDDITDTHSSKTRESWGQGVANTVTGLFGGMGRCVMIGQTMINVKTSGARTRLSTFLAGVSLLILLVVLGPLVATIPMAALVAVMIVVAALTFDWHSVAPATLWRMPRSETSVMLVTVAVVVLTHNLAYGVLAGTLTAMMLFARRVAHLVDVTSVTDPEGVEVIYSVHGELFFASSNDFVTQFDYANDPDRVVIDLSEPAAARATSPAWRACRSAGSTTSATTGETDLRACGHRAPPRPPRAPRPAGDPRMRPRRPRRLLRRTARRPRTPRRAGARPRGTCEPSGPRTRGRG